MAQLTTSLSLLSWLERPTAGIWEAMGSIPVGNSEFNNKNKILFASPKMILQGQITMKC